MTAADSLALLLAMAHRRLDHREVPKAPPHLPWADWCKGQP